MNLNFIFVHIYMNGRRNLQVHSNIEESIVPWVLVLRAGSSLHGVVIILAGHSRVCDCIVQGLHQVVIYISLFSEVFVDDLDGLLVDLVVLVSLKVLQVIEAILIFHHDCELILFFRGQEVCLSTLENVVYSLQCHCQHFDILKFED